MFSRPGKLRETRCDCKHDRLAQGVAKLEEKPFSVMQRSAELEAENARLHEEHRQLREENARLRAKVERLAKENTRLGQQLAAARKDSSYPFTGRQRATTEPRRSGRNGSGERAVRGLTATDFFDYSVLLRGRPTYPVNAHIKYSPDARRSCRSPRGIRIPSKEHVERTAIPTCRKLTPALRAYPAPSRDNDPAIANLSKCRGCAPPGWEKAAKERWGSAHTKTSHNTSRPASPAIRFSMRFVEL